MNLKTIIANMNKERIDKFQKKYFKRQKKRMSHVFTPSEVKLTKICSFVEKIFIYLFRPIHGSMYGYYGICDNCGSPISMFRVPVYGRVPNLDNETKIYFLCRKVFICPSCNVGLSVLGVFRTYDATDEFKNMMENKNA